MSTQAGSNLMRIARAGAVAGAVSVVGAAALALVPVSTAGLTSRPNPARSYDEAVTRFQRLRAQEGPEVNPFCFSRMFTHGRKVERAVILIHGVTNCPQQFAALGQLLHQQGANVLIPRMPHNGLADRMTKALSRLTARELCAFGDELVDIACGMGEQVVFVGLSAGGVIAAWVAQHRADVARSVIIAPSFAVTPQPVFRHYVMQNLFLRLPPIYRVDSVEVEQRKPKHTYLRNSSRGIGEIMRMGLATYRAARTKPPAADSVVFVVAENDEVVDNAAADRLIQRWRKRGYASIRIHSFPHADQLPHDMIDPHQPDQRNDLVYPVLLRYVMGD